MKVSTISRSKLKHTRERPQDLQKVHRNADPALHGFARAREYKRAVNAVKLDKVFAKPFVGALDGHSDGVYCMAASPTSLVAMVSGAGDGELKVWDVAYRKNLWSVKAHQGMVAGVTVCHDGRSFFSAGFDKKVHQFSLAVADVDNGASWQEQALQSWVGAAPFTSIDHHQLRDVFATASEGVSIWDHARSAPLSQYNWGHDTVRSLVAVARSGVETVKSLILLLVVMQQLLLLLLRCWC
jgi:WD repeat and SOF domain-containing protein 1